MCQKVTEKLGLVNAVIGGKIIKTKKGKIYSVKRSANPPTFWPRVVVFGQ